MLWCQAISSNHADIKHPCPPPYIFKDPKKLLEDPCIESHYMYKFSRLRGILDPQVDGLLQDCSISIANT